MEFQSYKTPILKVKKLSNSVKNYKFELNVELEKKLFDTKKLMEIQKYQRFDPFFSYHKKIISKNYTNNIITNAFLKLYEILYYYNFNFKKVCHFDNAALPGAFILAAHHYYNTIEILDYKWYASSLFNDKEDISFQDEYKLLSKYKKNWLINPYLKKTQGDLTNLVTQYYIQQRLLDKNVNLYTSDIGNNDFDNQEIVHLKLHIGQILSGLLTLKKNGVLIIKQYTFFHPLTIQIMGLLGNLFDNSFICKPISSRITNSENYLVCIGYNDDELCDEVVKLFVKKLENFDDTPFFPKNSMSKEFLEKISELQENFFKKQISALEVKLNFTKDESENWEKKVFKDYLKNHVKFKRISDTKRLI